MYIFTITCNTCCRVDCSDDDILLLDQELIDFVAMESTVVDYSNVKIIEQYLTRFDMLKNNI
jgi:hypothetical protein